MSFSYRKMRESASETMAPVLRFSRPLLLPALQIVFLLSLIGITYILFRTFQNTRRLQQGGGTSQIPVPPPPPLPSGRPVTPEQSPESEKKRTEKPKVDWQSTELLRKAAVLLADEGDLEGALELLRRNGDDAETVKLVMDASLGRIRHHMLRVTRREIRALHAYWGTLSDAEKQACFAPDRTQHRKELDLVLTADAGLDAIEKHLPASLTYAIMSNVHVQLSVLSKAPESILELFMGAAFPTASKGKVAYQQIKDRRAIRLQEHAKYFADAIFQQRLWPSYGDLLADLQRRQQKADPGVVVWYITIWGDQFCRSLESFNRKSSSPEFGLSLWRELPTSQQKFFASHCLAQSQEQLSEAVIRSSTFLREMRSPLNESYLIRAVRSHPDWQLSLREFDYRRAEDAAQEALQEMRAGKYFVKQIRGEPKLVWSALLTSLNSERIAFISKQFNWRALGNELGGVAEGIPAPIRKARRLRPSRIRGRLWKDVSPKKVYRALIQLSQRDSALGPSYRRLAKNYATNRNLQARH